MKVLITGVTGLLGSQLARHYSQLGHEVWGLIHRTHPQPELARHITPVHTPNELSGNFELAINLAGASIAGGRWTAQRKRALRDSRIGVTQDLLAQVTREKYHIDHLISGSAIGYYGSTTETVTEQSPAGTDFSAQMVADWEACALAGQTAIKKITLVRTGLVLSNRGGLLKQLALPARLGLAARLGHGNQGQSWIHETDWVNAITWLHEQGLTGPVNLTAPGPVSQNTFSRALANQLHRPYWLKVPATPVRWGMGELADLVLNGQWVVPSRLKEEGFTFAFPDLESALRDLLGER
ncbi:TIGR01777 family oxidoreductase [Saccharospirillum impatiens]|uniref:TIGR01777 family oxidoreductase n=1 Tax=Saccharospirillum impatiens TaxID=169438 RepID=UPI000414279D|nr:TIGR01777 family oxidoreductase [Saccharospirillum impatiens]